MSVLRGAVDKRLVFERVIKAAVEKGIHQQRVVIDDYNSIPGIKNQSYTNKAGIPTIDVYHFDSPTNFFPPYHHATSDNMSIIDRKTLKAVGQTMTQVLFVD